MGRPWDLKVLSYGLAVAAFWFGVNELLSPKMWVGFEPGFLATTSFAVPLVMIHGGLLCIIGLALVFNYYAKLASLIFAAMLIEIIGTFVFQGAAWDIVARDTALFGAALSIVLR